MQSVISTAFSQILSPLYIQRVKFAISAVYYLPVNSVKRRKGKLHSNIKITKNCTNPIVSFLVLTAQFSYEKITFSGYVYIKK